jgi:hypothetical protein
MMLTVIARRHYTLGATYMPKATGKSCPVFRVLVGYEPGNCAGPVLYRARGKEHRCSPAAWVAWAGDILEDA